MYVLTRVQRSDRQDAVGIPAASPLPAVVRGSVLTFSIERSALEPRVRERAHAAALAAGERLLEELEKPPRWDPNFERYACKNLNGTVGYALALLALAAATGDARYERAMHGQLKLASQAPGTHAGLFDGVSGLRAVASLATAVEPRYRSFVERCDAFVESALPQYPTRPAWVGDYDVVSGWSGMLLGRCVDAVPDTERLARLLEWIVEDERRWTCPASLEPGEPPKRWLGVAHGIAGVLGALAAVPGTIDGSLRDAMRRSARLVAQSLRNDGGVDAWPRAIEDASGGPYRSVWCVGAAGIGAALLQVAQRTHDLDLEAFACGVLTDVASRPSASMRFGGHGLCHGTLGNALVFFSAVRRTGLPAFAAACERLTSEAIEGIAEDGGCCPAIGNDGVVYDALGELNGLAGVSLALLTIAEAFDARWLAIHALA